MHTVELHLPGLPSSGHPVIWAAFESPFFSENLLYRVQYIYKIAEMCMYIQYAIIFLFSYID